MGSGMPLNLFWTILSDFYAFPMCVPALKRHTSTAWTRANWRSTSADGRIRLYLPVLSIPKSSDLNSTYKKAQIEAHALPHFIRDDTFEPHWAHAAWWQSASGGMDPLSFGMAVASCFGSGIYTRSLYSKFDRGIKDSILWLAARCF